MPERARPIKIVRIIARLNTGGPAVHTVTLTRGLSHGRFASRLVTGVVTAGEGDMSYYAETHGVRPLVIPELGRAPAPWRDVVAFWKIYRILAAEQPDIVHTHTTKAGALGRAAAYLYNRLAWLRGRRPARVVHTFHGHLFHGYFPSVWSRLLVFGERRLARITDRIVAISDILGRDLSVRYRICPADKIAVIPLGLDFGWVSALEARRGALRTACGVLPGMLVVGIVGRLTEIKNHPLLFDAMTRLRGDAIHALVIGDGELRGELEAAVQARDLEKTVTFAGWQRDTPTLYADLDVVCLTSHNEGTPVALIEAMAAGKAVVATRVGGVPDLVRGRGRPEPGGFEVFDTAVLVARHDAEALAAALRYLRDRPELRERMGVAARASVLERFSRERLIADTEALYSNLVGGDKEGTCGR